MKWSAKEIWEFKQIVESEWDYNFPGYQWAADRLNDSFRKNRSSSACYSMDLRMSKFSDEKWDSIKKQALDI